MYQLTMSKNVERRKEKENQNAGDEYNTIQYNGLYRVAHDRKETDNAVAVYKIKT